MRISDWSSDVCSSDLNTYDQKFNPDDPSKPSTVYAPLPPHEHRFGGIAGMNVVYDQTLPEGGLALAIRKGAGGVRAHDDRQSSVQGQRLSVRVSLGGRRSITQNTLTHEHTKKT